MDTFQKPLSSDKILDYENDGGSLPVTCRDYRLISCQGINYYLIDLKKIPWASLSYIIDECSYVEGQCWMPQENFSDYLKKCDILCYAEKDGYIIGFTAVTLMFHGTICLYSNDETMVLKEFRNLKIARNLVILPFEWVFTRSGRLRGTRHIVFFSVSANPKVVNFFFKNSWTRIVFDCSFKPSLQLIAAKNEYCRRNKLFMVHEDYPFCLKNLFPGSNRFDPHDPRFQFSEKVRANLPPDFDHMARGDAFAFLIKGNAKAARIAIAVLMVRCFGREYFTNSEIGLFSSREKGAPERALEKKSKTGWKALPVSPASREQALQSRPVSIVSPFNNRNGVPSVLE